MADTKLPNNKQHNPDSDEMLARRRLLKLGVYVPPAVMGMMIFGTDIAFADKTTASCCPNACTPCGSHPHGAACKNAKVAKGC